MLKGKPVAIKALIVYFLVNLICICFAMSAVVFIQDVWSSTLPMLAKVWLNTFLSVLVYGAYSIFVIPVALWTVITVFGLILLKKWARRFVVYLLMGTLAGGIVLLCAIPRIQAMNVYVRRGYQAHVYSKYWAPIKYQGNVGELRKFRLKENPLFQYESHGVYRTDFGSPQKAHFYRAIFNVARDAYLTSELLVDIVLLLYVVMVFAWCILIPTGFLWYFITRKEKSLEQL